MGEVLLHVLTVIVAAKIAAEVAERLGIPTVVGEIVAGVALGPSLLGLVGGTRSSESSEKSESSFSSSMSASRWTLPNYDPSDVHRLR